MRVSVLIPTRNRLPYLRLSLASAQAQDGADVEILVSDDGSTDGTRAFVAAVASDDRRVRLLTDNPSPGIFENVTYLIRHASGDSFTVLGDDDLLDPDFCRLLSDPLVAEPSVNLTFTGHRVIDSDGRLLAAATREGAARYGRAGLPAGLVRDPLSLALRGGIWLGFTVYRRSVFAGEPFDPECGTAADWDYAIRAARRGGIWFVPGPHGSYRDHRGTASRQGLRDEAALAIRLLNRYSFQEPAPEGRRRRLLRDAAKRHAFRAAPSDRGAAAESRRLYRELGGSRLNPHYALSSVMLRMPRPVAALAQRSIWGVTELLRRVARVAAR